MLFKLSNKKTDNTKMKTVIIIIVLSVSSVSGVFVLGCYLSPACRSKISLKSGSCTKGINSRKCDGLSRGPARR